MKQKYDRYSIEYGLAEEIVNLEEALKIANAMLNKMNKFGVSPSRCNPSFYRVSSFHAKVRKKLRHYHE